MRVVKWGQREILEENPKMSVIRVGNVSYAGGRVTNMGGNSRV